MKSARTGNHPGGRGDRQGINETLQFYAISAPGRTTRRKKLPPYSKTAARRLQDYAGPLTAVDIRIFTGREAWQRAAHRNKWLPSKPSICIPPNEDPASYRWELVRGTEPLVIETGGTPDSALQRLALVLLTAGARVVRVIFSNGRPMNVFRQGDHDG